MNLKTIIVSTFIAIFSLNTQVAYSQNIEKIYIVDKSSFTQNNSSLIIDSGALLLTNYQNKEEQNQALESMYKTGLFFPGLGQFMFQEYIKGTILMGLGLALVGTAIYGFKYGIWGVIGATVPSIYGLIILYFMSSIDLSMIYNKENREINNITKNKEYYELIERTYSYNALLPGLGSLISGDILRSFIYLLSIISFIVYGFLEYPKTSYQYSIIAIPLIYVVSMIDSTLKYNYDKNLYEVKEPKINNYSNQSFINENKNINLLSYNINF
ncbi:MAG: hypothetical protein U0354_04380 [Candidatus Sericytochromatia bacterium]